MTEVIILGIASLVLLACGRLVYEAITQKQVRVSGPKGKWYSMKPGAPYHWVTHHESPGRFLFWTSFYGICCGLSLNFIMQSFAQLFLS